LTSNVRPGLTSREAPHIVNSVNGLDGSPKQEETILQLRMLPGATAVAAIHAEELPQKDELCGAFWGAIALRAAGIEQVDGEPVDQDAVARRAGTQLSRSPEMSLPAGETGRRDFRLEYPITDDDSTSGTSAEGVLAAVHALSGDTLTVIPCTGEWTEERVIGLLDGLVDLDAPVTVIANVYTGDFWDYSASVGTLLGYLQDGRAEGPLADWKVGHFVGLAGTVSGENGPLVAIADTYRSLGWQGWHLQPAERVAAALTRSDGRAGGLLIVVPSAAADDLADRIDALGLQRVHWANGTDTLAA
jgi:hypothetical protein